MRSNKTIKMVMFVLGAAVVGYGVYSLLSGVNGSHQKIEKRKNKNFIKKISRKSLRNSLIANRTPNKSSDVSSNTGIISTGVSTEHRRKLILDYLKQNEFAVMSDISAILPDVTDRTLRRDMTFLEDSEIIKKVGSTKSTKYILN
ncbi:DeoR family transcriptional regulator [Candidatus Dojkabacteria bacterium]|nr:DeoR family transcriptional regulator [Candidatus Dojkabacteria bacterium]